MVELWPGMYKDLGFISYTHTHTQSQVPATLQLMVSVYKDEKKKNQSLYHTEFTLCVDQALKLCLREGSMADYDDDSWLLFLRHRKEGSKVKNL